jgi:hypothetical protein
MQDDIGKQLEWIQSTVSKTIGKLLEEIKPDSRLRPMDEYSCRFQSRGAWDLHSVLGLLV